MIKITTDLVVDAARITQKIYEANAIKLASHNHMDSALVEIKRAVVMMSLANDDDLCEMLAGRIHQLGHGT